MSFSAILYPVLKLGSTSRFVEALLTHGMACLRHSAVNYVLSIGKCLHRMLLCKATIQPARECRWWQPDRQFLAWKQTTFA